MTLRKGRRKARHAGDDRFLSLVRAASTLGISRLKVQDYALQHELDGEHVAGRFVVTRESVARLKAKLDAARANVA